MRNNWFVFQDFFSRNSIKCEKSITPPPPPNHPTFEIQNQNKGIEDIMDIDSNCPHLLFGETTSHLTVSEGALFNIIFFNVQNSIKREMRKNCFSTKKNSTPPPPPRIFFLHHFFFNVGNSMKREETMKSWKKKFLKFYFFQYLKNS